MSHNAPGVFGANKWVKGVGVQGNGPHAGVSGFSENGNAMRGFSSNGGDALHASTGSRAQARVFGNNTAATEISGGGAGVSV